MIKLGNRTFSPPWWATLLFLLVGSIMLLLGRWQLQRAEEKITLATNAETALAAAPVDVHELLVAGAGRVIDVREYSRLEASGQLLADRQFLWDNRIHKGQAGYEILVPLVLASEQESAENTVLLLNRGWVPAGLSRSEWPDVAMATSELTEFSRVEGLLTLPSRGFAGGPALANAHGGVDAETEWPKLLQYLDYSAIAESLGHSVVAGVVQPISSITPEFDGLLKTDNWQPVANGPEKHYGYAFQWFAMFVALSGIYWITNSRRIVDIQPQKQPQNSNTD